ncbi:DUF2637 domain-containing protein [Actinophytocola oryzae]|uniref:Uncharacterized protein DUF2637 n=1 Tax=Actinophytocola oryzae TaxID=502181 RepID=A0A4R7UVP5_9PSEU|nr:DUF2637 domain-containing protein [Actinophytocola oryzae]TDV40124.1 uncharacterized protein DUF2637 [Actinophytocola oryzae]
MQDETMKPDRAPTVQLGWYTWAGLAAVAVAASVLSFASLRHLAEACGTSGRLAWLLPVAIDAAAVVATRVWLARQAPAPARRQARRIALGAIVLSVVGNAVDHVLAAYRIVPPWWTVVAVAAVAPAVLGAVAHLVALVVAPDEDHEVTGAGEPGEPPLASPALQLLQTAEELVRAAEEEGAPMGRETLAGHLGVTPNQARQVLAVLRMGQAPPLALNRQAA